MNRSEETRQLEAAVSATNPNIASVNVRGFAKIDEFGTWAMAMTSGVIAFFSGLTYGMWKVQSDYSTVAALAYGFIFAWVSYNAYSIIKLYLSTSRIKAEYWDNEGEPEERPDGFIQSARSNERKRLTGRMRVFLQKFAQHYAELNTMAIGAWYQSKYLNRKQIEDVRAYTKTIGASFQVADGTYTLTDWGKEQLPKWAVADFGDVIELSQVDNN